MSDVLRDMIVSIDFKDVDTRRLLGIDRTMNGMENTLGRLGADINDVTGGLNNMGRTGQRRLTAAQQAALRARQEIERIDREAREAKESLNGMGGGIRRLGGIIATAFAGYQIKEFTTDAVKLAATARATESQFSQVFGDMETNASKALQSIGDETQIMPERLKSSFIQMAAFAKTTGASTADALDLTSRATLAAADSAAFYDRSIEDVTENLQSFLKGNFENDAALGISATETTRNAKATELYGKKFIELSEAQKQLTLLKMVEDGNKLSGALGQAAREGDGLENVTGNLRATWDKFKASIGDKVLDTTVDLMKELGAYINNLDADKIGDMFAKGFEYGKKMIGVAKEVLGFIKDLGTWGKDNIDYITAATLGLLSAVLAFKTMTTVVALWKTMTTLMAAYKAGTFLATAATLGLNTALLASPIGWITLAVGGLVAGGVLLYKNFDTVKAKALELFETLKSFVMPEWMQNVGKIIGKGASAVGNFVKGKYGDLMGSHATGLERVPFDGYTAELHKGESVLTASQSNMLRNMGVLKSNGDKPKLDMSQAKTSLQTPNNSNTTIAPEININVQVAPGDGANDLAKKAALAAKYELQKLFRQLNMQFN